MGIIAAEKINNLWWMGRYTERVFTTIKLFMSGMDYMLDRDEEYYKTVCRRLGVPDVYKDGDDFIARYPFDESDPNSIISNLNRAMDNAMILRETIGSETLSYLQLAVYDMKSADGASDLIKLQHVLDHILAFWGSVEDNVYSEGIRNVARAGKRLEKFDLMLRLEKATHSELTAAWNRLKARLDRSPIVYNKDNLETLKDVISADPIDYRNALSLLMKITEP